MSAFRAVTLPPTAAGALWLASMPGRFEPWAAFVAEAARVRVDEVVCLTRIEEVAALSPRYHAAIVAGDLPFRWRSLPVPNFGVPADREAFRRDLRAMAAAIVAGDSVVLHCAAGIGRTGSAAACVLKALGVDTARALELVRGAGSNPENAEQSGLVEWF